MEIEPLTKVAQIRLAYKTKIKATDQPKITRSKDAYEVLIKNWNPEKIELLEEFKVLLLNRANRCLGEYKVSSGSTTATVVEPKFIFAAAIKANASGIILGHNHPSGELKPSQADIALTKKIKAGAELFDILVLDHLIVTKEGYFSFADDGLI